jgi:DNA end-binding protein Ku
VKRLVLGAGIAALTAVLWRPLTQLVVLVRDKFMPPLDELTKEELYRRAQDADIPGRSEMSKDELVRALQKS